jgi:hypothetical protein
LQLLQCFFGVLQSQQNTKVSFSFDSFLVHIRDFESFSIRIDQKFTIPLSPKEFTMSS